jgi:hypothetical protein
MASKHLQEITNQLYELKFQGEITTKAQIENKLQEVVAYERLRILINLKDLSLKDVPIKLYLGMVWRAILYPKDLVNFMCKVALNYARLVIDEKEIPETLKS